MTIGQEEENAVVLATENDPTNITKQITKNGEEMKDDKRVHTSGSSENDPSTNMNSSSATDVDTNIDGIQETNTKNDNDGVTFQVSSDTVDNETRDEESVWDAKKDGLECTNIGQDTIKTNQNVTEVDETNVERDRTNPELNEFKGFVSQNPIHNAY